MSQSFVPALKTMHRPGPNLATPSTRTAQVVLQKGHFIRRWAIVSTFGSLIAISLRPLHLTGVTRLYHFPRSAIILSCIATYQLCEFRKLCIFCACLRPIAYHGYVCNTKSLQNISQEVPCRIPLSDCPTLVVQSSKRSFFIYCGGRAVKTIALGKEVSDQLYPHGKKVILSEDKPCLGLGA